MAASPPICFGDAACLAMRAADLIRTAHPSPEEPFATLLSASTVLAALSRFDHAVTNLPDENVSARGNLARARALARLAVAAPAQAADLFEEALSLIERTMSLFTRSVDYYDRVNAATEVGVSMVVVRMPLTPSRWPFSSVWSSLLGPLASAAIQTGQTEMGEGWIREAMEGGDRSALSAVAAGMLSAGRWEEALSLARAVGETTPRGQGLRPSADEEKRRMIRTMSAISGLHGDYDIAWEILIGSGLDPIPLHAVTALVRRIAANGFPGNSRNVLAQILIYVDNLPSDRLDLLSVALFNAARMAASGQECRPGSIEDAIASRSGESQPGNTAFHVSAIAEAYALCGHTKEAFRVLNKGLLADVQETAFARERALRHIAFLGLTTGSQAEAILALQAEGDLALFDSVRGLHAVYLANRGRYTEAELIANQINADEIRAHAYVDIAVRGALVQSPKNRWIVVRRDDAQRRTSPEDALE